MRVKHTLVEEVDGFHAGIFLVANIQLMELVEQINQPLHYIHSIFAKPGRIDRNRVIMNS